MEGKPSRAHLKRPFVEDENDDNKQPAQKKVRFPKGKKVKLREAINRGNDEAGQSKDDPRQAAKERAKLRRQSEMEIEEVEISAAEVAYEDNENFIDDGIQVEPFNLDKEREEGYFDDGGNFIEYVNNETKDAWLDSIEADPKVAGSISTALDNEENNEDAINDLSSKDIGTIKRRIADALEPGETVLQGLRRLKGTSNRKEKMSADTKRVFDQLTEDAMRLMDDGDYDVYNERQEVFQREAEGYEKLAKATGKGISASSGDELSNPNLGNGIFSGTFSGVSSSAVPDSHSTAAEVSGNDAEAFDMFGDDDGNAKPSPEPNSTAVSQATSNAAVQTAPETGDTQSDYAYDESSGYYYSSSLGYYYDPSTGLYCSAASGQWYSFNEETGSYEEVQSTTS